MNPHCKLLISLMAPPSFPQLLRSKILGLNFSSFPSRLPSGPLVSPKYVQTPAASPHQRCCGPGPSKLPASMLSSHPYSTPQEKGLSKVWSDMTSCSWLNLQQFSISLAAKYKLLSSAPKTLHPLLLTSVSQLISLTACIQVRWPSFCSS